MTTDSKGQNLLRQFPRSKSATSWHGKKSVVSRVMSFPKFHYNDLATSWQLPRLWESYGETRVMDFGHYEAHDYS